MSSTHVAGRAARRREAEQRRKRVALAVVSAVVILVTVIAMAFSGSGAPSGSPGSGFEYGPDDVARESPVVAVHEMTAGPPILFLPASEPQPAIAVDKSFVNVGTVGPSEVVRLNFLITNTGEAPLTISRAYTTCGCTTADISSTTIPPGKVAEVTLKFDAGFHDARGQTVRRGLILENYDLNHSDEEISMQATVRSS